MYYLAAYSEYIKPLREEIEAVVNEHGWSKTSMGKMRKLDSLLKESQRMTGLGSRMLSFFDPCVSLLYSLQFRWADTL